MDITLAFTSALFLQVSAQIASTKEREYIMYGSFYLLNVMPNI